MFLLLVLVLVLVLVLLLLLLVLAHVYTFSMYLYSVMSGSPSPTAPPPGETSKEVLCQTAIVKKSCVKRQSQRNPLSDDSRKEILRLILLVLDASEITTRRVDTSRLPIYYLRCAFEVCCLILLQCTPFGGEVLHFMC